MSHSDDELKTDDDELEEKADALDISDDVIDDPLVEEDPLVEDPLLNDDFFSLEDDEEDGLDEGFAADIDGSEY